MRGCERQGAEWFQEIATLEWDESPTSFSIQRELMEVASRKKRSLSALNLEPANPFNRADIGTKAGEAVPVDVALIFAFDALEVQAAARALVGQSSGQRKPGWVFSPTGFQRTARNRCGLS